MIFWRIARVGEQEHRAILVHGGNRPTPSGIISEHCRNEKKTGVSRRQIVKGGSDLPQNQVGRKFPIFTCGRRPGIREERANCVDMSGATWKCPQRRFFREKFSFLQTEKFRPLRRRLAGTIPAESSETQMRKLDKITNSGIITCSGSGAGASPHRSRKLRDGSFLSDAARSSNQAKDFTLLFRRAVSNACDVWRGFDYTNARLADVRRGSADRNGVGGV